MSSSAPSNPHGDWCTIESDPGVFTELLEELECTGVELQELWSLDDESLAALGTVYGLIFLFQYGKDKPVSTKTCIPQEDRPSDLFFAHQVATNACATQAILSVVLNALGGDKDSEGVSLGPKLAEFRSFVSDFPPDLKGASIASSELLKSAHNAFARPEGTFLTDGKFYDRMASEDDEVYHFVAYLPHSSKVYELDGLQQGPILVEGDADADESSPLPSWLSVARKAIQTRMESANGVRFNLMAVTKDRRIGAPESEMGALQAQRLTWKRENQRRRHNYVPLCVNLLKELAKAGKLPELTEQAKKRVQEKKKAAAAAKSK